MAYILLTISACGCNNQIKPFKNGSVIIITKDQDSASAPLKKSNFFPAFKLWYKDSCIIEEIKVSETSLDSNGHSIRKSYLHHYSYIDLTTGYYYDYGTFSDTAKLLKKYHITKREDVHGWNFMPYLKKPSPQYSKILRDTIISNTSYKRYMIYSKGMQDSSKTVEVLGYARCDKKGTLFDFGISFGTLHECPITRIDYLPTKEQPLILAFEIEFLSESLTAEELKVFEAWKRNAKQLQVKDK